METLKVTLVYEPEGIPGSKVLQFILEKTFKFKKLPPLGTIIELDDEPIDLYFTHVKYNPKTNIYSISNYTCRNVERYYHGEDRDLMQPLVDKLISCGWKVVSEKII